MIIPGFLSSNENFPNVDLIYKGLFSIHASSAKIVIFRHLSRKNLQISFFLEYFWTFRDYGFSQVFYERLRLRIALSEKVVSRLLQ